MKRKQQLTSLSQLLGALLLLTGLFVQSCKKSNDGAPPPVDGTPKETATLKYIPDSMFRQYLKANVCPNAFDKTGKLIDITNSEVKDFTGTMNIDTITCPSPFVQSLKGIQYFAKMTKLIVKNSALDSLDLSSTMAIDTLRLLLNADLQSVNVSGCTSMRYIRASAIPVTSLDLSNLPALNYVNLISLQRLSDLRTNNDGNLHHLMTYGLISMRSLDVSSNPELRRLYLESATAINNIDVTHNPKLYGLVATYSGAIHTVDVSKNDSLLYVQFDDSNIDSIDFSHNHKLVSVAMLRTPLRNLDFRANPNLKLLYLDGCGQLKNVDLRAQTSFNYYSVDFHQYYALPEDDANQIFQTGFVSTVQDAQHTVYNEATRQGVNGATTNLFGGLRLPNYLDGGGLSLSNVKMNDATKDNYSIVMARRVLGNMTPVLETVYAADQTTVLCADYDPTLFKCN